MTYISKQLRHKVAVRAHHRCEYCLTSQKISGAQMHMEHIIPRVLDGPSIESNLCLACAWCNSYKGDKMKAVDPLTVQKVPLFNARTQLWSEHFDWSDDGLQIVGLTPTGRATVFALKMNNEYIVEARRHWVQAGWHPPQ